MVGNIEATIIEVINGSVVRRGSAKPIEEVGMILLVLDPRQADVYLDPAVSELLTPEVKAKTRPFLLMPSITSSPECLTLCELVLMSCGIAMHVVAEGVDAKDVISLVRLDDYLVYGDSVLVAMAAAGKRMYPAEEAGNLLGWFEELMELAAKPPTDKDELEDYDGPEKRSRVSGSIYGCRAYCHWVVGSGLEEGSICDTILEPNGPIQTILKDESLRLPALGGCPVATTASVSKTAAKALCPIKGGGTPVFLAFSEASAAKYTASIGVPVTSVILGLDPEKEYYRDESATVNGVPFIDFMQPMKDGRPAFLLVEPGDLAPVAKKGGYASPATWLASKLREEAPSTSLTVVLLAENAKALGGNMWLCFALHQFVENTDVVLFASEAEAPKIGDFFARPAAPDENVALVLAKQAIPFPRLHFFCFDSCLGEPLADGGILTPALTVGPPSKAAALSPAQFSSEGAPCRRFLLTGPDMKSPLWERRLRGAEGSPGATVVHSGAFVCQLIQQVTCPHAGKYWDLAKLPEKERPKDGGPLPCISESLFFESIGISTVGGEDMLMQLTEALSNAYDCLSEYEQYLGEANVKSMKKYEPPADWLARCKVCYPDEEEEEG